MPKIYLAGPMTGIPEFNFPKFMETAEALQEGGWTVFNPAQNDIDKGHDPNDPRPYRLCLYDDLVWITQEADAIYMMTGWENSKGARAEWATAVAIGIQILYESE